MENNHQNYVVEEIQLSQQAADVLRDLITNHHESVVLATPLQLEEQNRGRVWPEHCVNTFQWQGAYAR